MYKGIGDLILTKLGVRQFPPSTNVIHRRPLKHISPRRPSVVCSERQYKIKVFIQNEIRCAKSCEKARTMRARTGMELCDDCWRDIKMDYITEW